MRGFSPTDLLLFLILLFGPIAHGLVEIWTITVVHLAVIALISFTLLISLYQGNFRLYRTSVDLPVLLFCIIALLSLCVSVYPHASRTALYRLFTYLALFYFIVNTQGSWEKLLRLCQVIVIFSGMYAFAGLFWTQGSLLFFEVQSEKGHFISLFFANHCHFAGYLELTLWLAFGLAIYSRKSSKIFFFCIGIVIAIAITFSLSRGGIIGMIAGFCFCLVVLIRIEKEGMSVAQWLLLLFVFAVFMTLVWLHVDPVIERMQTLENPLEAGKARIEMWQGTLNMIADRPLLGWGLGSFPFAFPPYQVERISAWFINHAHNDYLELAAETGLLGLAAALLTAYVFFASCLKRLIRARHKYFQAIGVGALASCFSLLVHAITDFNFHIPSNALQFAVTAGIAVVAAAGAAGKRRQVVCVEIQFSPRRKWIVALLVFLTASLSSAAVLSPYWGHLSLVKAMAYMEQGEYESAASTLERGMRYDPGNAQLLRSMGDLHFMQFGREERKRLLHLRKALGWYEQAIAASPVEGENFSRKGNVLEQLQRSVEAEQLYQQALQRYPVHAFASYRLAALHLRQEQLDAAFKHYRRFLELGGQRYLSMVLEDIWGEAGQNYDLVQQAIPETAAFRQAFARWLFAKEKVEPALQELILAYSIEPTAKNALVHIQALHRMKDYPATLTEIDKYLTSFPENIQLREQKAIILKHLGRNQEAIFMYRWLQKNSTNDTEEAQQIRFYLATAQLYGADKRHEEAVVILTEGIKKNLQDARLYYQLRSHLQAMKRTEEAFNVLKKVVALEPNNVRYRHELGQGYSNSKMNLSQ